MGLQRYRKYRTSSMGHEKINTIHYILPMSEQFMTPGGTARGAFRSNAVMGRDNEGGSDRDVYMYAKYCHYSLSHL